MKVIILNGPSSSGKSSIGKCLQDILDENYIMLGLDNIIYTMPEKTNDYQADMIIRDGFYWVAETGPNNKPLMHLTMGKYAQKIYSMLKMQVKSFADHGFNVIVDHMSLENDYADWRTLLGNHEVIFCGITASNNELDRRENERKDRVIGVARAHAEKVHAGYDYNTFIDTTRMSSLDAAKEIQRYISST